MEMSAASLVPLHSLLCTAVVSVALPKNEANVVKNMVICFLVTGVTVWNPPGKCWFFLFVCLFLFC